MLSDYLIYGKGKAGPVLKHHTSKMDRDRSVATHVLNISTRLK
jgi:hypothetical protein